MVTSCTEASLSTAFGRLPNTSSTSMYVNGSRYNTGLRGLLSGLLGIQWNRL